MSKEITITSSEQMSELEIARSEKETLLIDPLYEEFKDRAYFHYRELAQRAKSTFQWRPYQPEFAALYCVRRNNICALTQGLGKTIITGLKIAVLYGYLIKSQRPGIIHIAAPSQLSATTRWLVDLQKIPCLQDQVAFINSERDIFNSSAPVWVYTHDFVKRKAKSLEKGNRPFMSKRIYRSHRMPNELFIDEAHQLKAGTKRSKHLAYVRQYAKRCTLLSGTISDGRLDLIDFLCQFTYQSDWPYKGQEFKKYFGAKRALSTNYLYGSGQSADVNTREISHLSPARLAEFSHIIERFIHRASYNDVNIKPFVTLPEAEIIVKSIEPAQEHRQYYQRIIREKQSALLSLMRYGSAAKMASALQMLHPVLEASNTPPEFLGNYKLEALLDAVEEFAQVGKKTAVFCKSVGSARLVTKTLEQRYPNYNPLRVYAEDKDYNPPRQTQAQRQDVVSKFLFEDDKLVGVFSINLASESIDLTSAHQLIFYDYPWESIKIQQAIFRVRRPGSIANSVRIVYLGNKGFIDEHQQSLLAEKINSSKLLLDFDVNAIQENQRGIIDVKSVVEKVMA